MKYEVFSMHGIFRSIGEQTILSDISLRVYRGEITFLIGPSDSGKSILAQIAAGRMLPDRGCMYLDGKPYRPSSQEDAHARGVFCISSSTPLAKNISIGENIGLTKPPFSVCWKYRNRLEAYVRIVCERYRFRLDLSKNASNLTWIEQLQVHCARAAFGGAKFLIFDNVLHMLTDKETQLFFEKLSKLKADDFAILIIESSAQCGLQYGDHSVFLADGRIVADLPRGADLLAQKVALLMENNGYVKERRGPLEDFSNKALRSFRCMTPNGPLEIPVRRGEILGISSQSNELLGWYANHFFGHPQACALYQQSNQRNIRVLTLQSLQTDYFPNLSFQENVFLPVFSQFKAHGFLSEKRYRTFLESELAQYLSVPPEKWKKKLYLLGNQEREAAVLFRTLLEDAEIIVLSGLSDQINEGLQQNVRNMISLATARGKSVIIFGQKIERLKELCSSIVLLE